MVNLAIVSLNQSNLFNLKKFGVDFLYFIFLKKNREKKNEKLDLKKLELEKKKFNMGKFEELQFLNIKGVFLNFLFRKRRRFLVKKL